MGRLPYDRALSQATAARGGLDIGERSDQHRLAIEIDVDRGGAIAHGFVSR
jgi:hypothetical protein